MRRLEAQHWVDIVGMRVAARGVAGSRVLVLSKFCGLSKATGAVWCLLPHRRTRPSCQCHGILWFCSHAPGFRTGLSLGTLTLFLLALASGLLPGTQGSQETQ